MRDFLSFFISVALLHNRDAEFDREMQQWKYRIIIKRTKEEVHVFCHRLYFLYPVVNPPSPTQAEERL